MGFGEVRQLFQRGDRLADEVALHRLVQGRIRHARLASCLDGPELVDDPADGLQCGFDAGHSVLCTEFRMSLQAKLRNPVITEFRSARHCARMAKRDPSKRAQAFKAWMAAANTNTKQVSERAGVPYTTLASFVQGDTQSLKGDNEERIAQAFGVSAMELFAEGAGKYVPIIGRVGADSEGNIIYTNADATGEIVPIPPGGTEHAVALRVVGHSMGDWAPEGSLIYFESQKTPPTPDMLGYPCVVETEDGKVLLKRLLKGSKPGLYDLESLIGPTLEDVRLQWAAEITANIPPRQARRIIRQASERHVA